MIIEWQQQFDAALLLHGAIVGIAFLGLVAPGFYCVYSTVAPRSATREQAVSHWLCFLSLLFAGWVGWIYSLGFAPSWGTVPSDAESTPYPVFTEMSAAAEYDEARADLTETIGRGGVIGGLDSVGFGQLVPNEGTDGPVFPTRRPYHGIPHVLFAFVQFASFAAFSVPLLILLSDNLGPLRAGVSAVVWGTVVYAPLAHWTWGEGWLTVRGVLDASGATLHLAAGASALGLMLIDRFVGTEQSAVREPMKVGTGPGVWLVWLGALLTACGLTFTVDGRLAAAILNTQLAAVAGTAAWWGTSAFMGDLRRGIEQAPWGALAGLVAIAGGSSMLVPNSAVVVGLAAGAVACMALRRAFTRASFRAAWTIFSVQGLPAIIGLLLTGVFASGSVAGLDSWGRPIQGVIAGNTAQLVTQLIAVGAVSGWAIGFTLVGLLPMQFQFSGGESASSETSTASTNEST